MWRVGANALACLFLPFATTRNSLAKNNGFVHKL